MDKFKRSVEILQSELHMGSGRVVIRTKEGEYIYHRSQCLMAYEDECSVPRMEREMVWKRKRFWFSREMKIRLVFQDSDQRNQYHVESDTV